jgi:hypothetical protein
MVCVHRQESFLVRQQYHRQLPKRGFRAFVASVSGSSCGSSKRATVPGRAKSALPLFTQSTLQAYACLAPASCFRLHLCVSSLFVQRACHSVALCPIVARGCASEICTCRATASVTASLPSFWLLRRCGALSCCVVLFCMPCLLRGEARRFRLRPGAGMTVVLLANYVFVVGLLGRNLVFFRNTLSWHSAGRAMCVGCTRQIPGLDQQQHLRRVSKSVFRPFSARVSGDSALLLLF